MPDANDLMRSVGASGTAKACAKEQGVSRCVEATVRWTTQVSTGQKNPPLWWQSSSSPISRWELDGARDGIIWNWDQNYWTSSWDAQRGGKGAEATVSL